VKQNISLRNSKLQFDFLKIGNPANFQTRILRLVTSKEMSSEAALLVNRHPIRIEVEDKGILKVLQGSLPLTLEAGEYKERIPASARSNLPPPDWLTDWLNSTGLDQLSGAHAEHVLANAGPLWELSQSFLPQLSPSEERLQLFARYLIFCTLASEHEEMVSLRSGNSKMVEMMAELVSDVMKSRYASQQDLPEVPKSTIPLFKALFSLREDSKDVIPDFIQTSIPLVTAMRTSVIANSRLGLKMMLEVPETFKYFKRHSGWEVLIELGALLLGLNLPPAMRQDLMLQRIIGLASGIVSMLADLSQPGQGHDETSFLSFLQKARGVELEEAFQLTLTELEKDVKEFKILCHTLRGLNKKNMRLSKYLKTVGTFIDGYSLAYHC